ncbi:uncharacterized protein LOC129950905 [Eupeodes corollae]|uniref:uncharacterized protein LOC129950905 n=1 Tax=Eupeodes corollae TaxID=290404 RepID=UPI0024910A0C|nr:uncharacterized protein LOC129950905 [Eupeodes corollae]
MSKNKKVEQIIQSDKVYSSDKDNAGNKSTSSSPLHPIEQQENQQHSTTNAIGGGIQAEAEQWQSSGIVKTTSQGSSPQPPLPTVGIQATGTPEHMRGAATKDMFDLIERVQCSRIDDQRCVLPAYFSQLPY